MKEDNKGLIIPKEVETIVLIVLSAFVLFVSVFRLNSVVGVILAFLTTALILLSVWLLYFNKNYLASYLVLGLTIYFRGFYQLISFIFSFSFGGSMTVAFDWVNIILALGSGYLGYLIVVHYLKDRISFNKDKFKLDLLMLAFAGFAFLSEGVEGLIYLAIVCFIAGNFKTEALLAIMLSKAITPPLGTLLLIIESGFGAVTLMDLLLINISIGLIVLIVNKTLIIFKENKIRRLIDFE